MLKMSLLCSLCLLSARPFAALAQLTPILQQEKEYLTDVTQELELEYEDRIVPYKIGDSFVHIPQSMAMQLLEKNTSRVDEEIEEIESRISANSENMDQLKVELYSKFGKAINLDV
jgi:prefoldin subunit 4